MENRFTQSKANIGANKKRSFLKTVIRSAQKISPPGFGNLPFFYVAPFFLKGIQRGAITSRASSLAFNFFLALFPAIIFFFTLIPYVPIPHFQDQLLTMIQQIMPANAFDAARSTIEDIIRHQRSGLLSFGFFAALYFATNGVHAMIDAFNRTYHTIERRSFMKQRIIALIITVILSILVVSAITLLVMSQTIIRFFVKHGWVKNKTQIFFLATGNWITIAILIFLSISIIYYFGPRRKKRWSFISAGSVLASILSIITSLGFSFFVNNFGQYNKLYGSVGTLIVVLLWIYFNSLILLIGFELNASIFKAKDENSVLLRRRSRLYQ